MIISTEQKKHWTKSYKLQMERNSLTLIKCICKMLIVNIMLHSKDWMLSPLDKGQFKYVCSCINHSTSLCSKTWKGMRHPNWKKSTTAFILRLFDIYIETPVVSTGRLSRVESRINEFSLVSRDKNDIKNSILCLQINKKQQGTEILKTIPFTIASKTWNT